MFSYRVNPGSTDVGGAGIAFSDRHGGVTPGARGSLNLGRSDVDPAVEVNMQRTLAALRVDRVVALHQVHGTAVYVPSPEDLAGLAENSYLGSASGVPLPAADAVVLSRDSAQRASALTGRPTAFGVTIRVADCLPVVFLDPDRGLIGAAHAGRVGLLAGVLPATVAALRDRGATALRAVIGPAICGACYEVPPAMRDEATGHLPDLGSQTRWGTPSLDLPRAAVSQLAGLGVPTRNLGMCTRTRPDLHSYRRDGADSGRLAAFAWFTAPTDPRTTP